MIFSSARHRCFLPSILLIGVLLCAYPESKATQGKFPPTYKFGTVTLNLSGRGSLTYLGFIEIYDGALYLPPGETADNVLNDIPKRLEVIYLRDFKAEDFGPATISGMKKNVPSEILERLRSRIVLHNSLYTDTKKGDRVSLTYVPSIGTRLEINETVKGSVKGADFARALFSLWLGEKPFDANFKEALLGKK